MGGPYHHHLIRSRQSLNFAGIASKVMYLFLLLLWLLPFLPPQWLLGWEWPGSLWAGLVWTGADAVSPFPDGSIETSTKYYFGKSGKQFLFLVS